MDAAPSSRFRVASCSPRRAPIMRTPPWRRRCTIATPSTPCGRSLRRRAAAPMPGIVAGALVAHPPILLAEVGGAQSQRVRATADGLRDLDGILCAVEADL